VAQAIRTSRWDDALSLAPNSVAALVGRARSKLAARPPDIDGAFADLERAEKLSPVSADVKVALGTAHATRATAHARGDRLAEAAQDLAEAVGLNGDAQAIAVARAAIVAGWLTRADKAIDKRDPSLVQVACDAAAKCGATRENLLDLWREYAAVCVGRLDRPGLTTACAEASRHGLTLPEVGTLWLRYGDEAVAKKDLAAAKAACDAALKADATMDAVRPLQVRATVLEAQEMVAQGKTDDAVALAMTAIDKDAAASMTMLGETETGDLRKELTNAYRKRFDSATAADDWSRAMMVQGEAARMNPEAGTWMAAALTPDRVRRLPATASAAIPAFMIAALPRLRNSIGMEFRLIPAGTFTMGEDDRKSPQAKPHPVTLTKPFSIGVYEVTNAQWQAVMGSVPSTHTDAEQPVDRVSWNDAIDFCQKLSALPEERAAARTYRLPTEAEWEYACRAGSTSRYSFGDSEKMLDEYGWYDRNSGNRTRPVGEKKPNPWGLHDMHGNVWEWCNDFYDGFRGEKATDPLGPVTSLLGRVRRGGSARNPAGGSRSGLRSQLPDKSRWEETGFRVVMSPSLATSSDEMTGKPSPAGQVK
jgi:formylglycine-generating enzyme required for sulfatase activity